jgi:hypothetical protein
MEFASYDGSWKSLGPIVVQNLIFVAWAGTVSHTLLPAIEGASRAVGWGGWMFRTIPGSAAASLWTMRTLRTPRRSSIVRRPATWCSFQNPDPRTCYAMCFMLLQCISTIYNLEFCMQFLCSLNLRLGRCRCRYVMFFFACVSKY